MESSHNFPPTLYFNSKTGKWTEEEVPGAPTWQHKTMFGYEGWKRAQANRKRAAENARYMRRKRAEGQRQHVMECLMALLSHWENDRGRVR